MATLFQIYLSTSYKAWLSVENNNNTERFLRLSTLLHDVKGAIKASTANGAYLF